jgi:prepilin-type N-terminal cleavage/methylation domain-containing protein
MKKAFTLVELLIAVVLLTLLMGTALFSYRQALLNITKAERSTFNDVLKVHQLRTSIESMQHYVVDDYNQLNQPMKKLHIFFKGTQHYFQYISLNPTFSTIPSLSSFECKDKKLVFREEILYYHIDVNRPNFLEESKEMIYWKDIDVCTFEYFLHEKVLNNIENILPTAVHISFLDSDEKKHDFFIAIKSDNNVSKYFIHEYLYGE